MHFLLGDGSGGGAGDFVELGGGPGGGPDDEDGLGAGDGAGRAVGLALGDRVGSRRLAGVRSGLERVGAAALAVGNGAVCPAGPAGSPRTGADDVLGSESFTVRLW